MEQTTDLDRRQSRFDKLEEILINAPKDELPGLMAHADLVVRLRGLLPAQPAKRPYVRKKKTEEKGEE